MTLRNFAILTLLFISFGTLAQSSQIAIERVKNRLQQSAEQQLTSLQRLPSNSVNLAPTQVQLNKLPLPSGLSINAILRPTATNTDNVETFVGNTPEATIRINKRGSASITTIQTTTHRWKVLTLDGESIIYDDAELPDRITMDDGIIRQQPPQARGFEAPPSSTAASDGPQTFDTIILYTQATVEYYEGEDLALARIADIVDTTNEIYSDSNVPLIMNLHKTFKLDYDPENAINSRTVLYDMTADSDVFGAAYQYALAAGVDYLITMRPFVDGDSYCGIAFIGGIDNSNYNPNSVMTSHTSIDCGDYVNAHELGHNMGLAHSRAQGDDGYAFPYAIGYGKTNDFVTVMAYNSAYYDEDQTGYPEKLYNFSNPELTCNGSPCGIEHTRADSADAARALRLRVDKLAHIRDLTPLKDTFIRVSSDYARIRFNQQSETCIGQCFADFDKNTSVTITATPLAGFEVDQWGGACEGATGNQCRLTTDGLHSISLSVTERYAQGISVNQALDNDDLSFSTVSYQGSWRVDQDTSQVGDYSLRSPLLQRYQDVKLETEVVGKGELSFWAKTSFSNEQSLAVRTGYRTQASISGTTEWTYYSFEVDEYYATNDISFYFYTSSEAIAGDRRFWIDDVQFTPDPDANKPVAMRVKGNGELFFETYNSICRNDCDYYPPAPNGEHRFEAMPLGDSEFIGWGGDCRGTDPVCVVSSDEYRLVYAYFSGESDKLSSQQIGTAVDNNELYFYDAGSSNYWQINDQGSNGNDSIIGRGNSNYRSYTLTAFLEGEGTLSFDYNLSNVDPDNDDLYAIIDGYYTIIRGDTSGWKSFSTDLSEGQHTIEWLAQLRGSEDANSSIALDNIQWTGDTAPYKGATLNVMGGRGAIRVDDIAYCRDQCRVDFGGYTADQVIDIFAEPNSESQFIRWEGACRGQTAHCMLQVSSVQDAQITAVFEDSTYTVTAASNSGGVITPESQEVVVGDTAQLSVTPLIGQQLTSIQGCDGSLSGQNYVTAEVYADCHVTALFEALEYQVSFDLGDYGQRSGGGELQQSVHWGESAIEPNVSVLPGWSLSGWSQPFDKITEDTNVQAVYQKIEGAIRVDLGVTDNAQLSLKPIQYVTEGSSLSVTVRPDAGYRLVRTVSGTCNTGVWNKTTYTIPNITQDCSALFSVSSILESGSLLLILSAEPDEQ